MTKQISLSHVETPAMNASDPPRVIETDQGVAVMHPWGLWSGNQTGYHTPPFTDDGTFFYLARDPGGRNWWRLGLDGEHKKYVRPSFEGGSNNRLAMLDSVGEPHHCLVGAYEFYFPEDMKLSLPFSAQWRLGQSHGQAAYAYAIEELNDDMEERTMVAATKDGVEIERWKLSPSDDLSRDGKFHELVFSHTGTDGEGYWWLRVGGKEGERDPDPTRPWRRRKVFETTWRKEHFSHPGFFGATWLAGNGAHLKFGSDKYITTIAEDYPHGHAQFVPPNDLYGVTSRFSYERNTDDAIHLWDCDERTTLAEIQLPEPPDDINMIPHFRSRIYERAVPGAICVDDRFHICAHMLTSFDDGKTTVPYIQIVHDVLPSRPPTKTCQDCVHYRRSLRSIMNDAQLALEMGSKSF